MTLPLSLGKFQICVVPECGRDATQQVITEEGNPLQYYLGVCGSAEHLLQVEKVARSIATTPNPVALLGLDRDQVFVRPAGRSTKCKLVHFNAPPKRDHTVRVPTKPKVPTACSEWEWEARPDRWMTLEGKSVRISALPNAEFVCSCLAVSRLNYKRVTRTTSWVKQLVLPRVPCVYDENKLDVGPAEAGWKLAEFKREAANRGLI